MTNYVFYSPDKHEFVISGLPINRLRTRISETYKSISGYSQIKGSSLFNIFNKMEYIEWDKTEVRFFSFFALEVYEMFADLSEKYNDDSYKDVAEEIYKKSWISNFETKEKIKMPLNKLSMFQFAPKDFQREFIEQYSTLKYQYDLDGYILSFDQGLGKTLTSIVLAECLNKEHIYIICPNALKMTWANEIKKYYKKYEDEELWKNEVFVSGTPLGIYHENTKFFIVNQESIQNIFPYVSAKKNNMIIVDEVQNFRGVDAKRVTLLLQLKNMVNCHDCLLMSGTPIKALPNEMVPAMRVIDPHFTKELANIYYKTFADKSTDSAAIVRERFRRVIYRKLKKDIKEINLPDKFISDMRLKIPHPEKFGIGKAKDEILNYYHQEYLERLKSGIFTNNKKSLFYRSSAGNYSFKNEQAEFERIVRKYSRAHSEKTEYYLNYIFQRTEDRSWELINSHNVDRKYFEFLKTFVIPYMPKNESDNLMKNFNGILGWSIAAKSASASAIGTIINDLKNECFNTIWDFNYEKIIEQILKNEKKTIIFTTQLPVAEHISNSLTKNGIKNVKICGGLSNRDKLVDDFKNDSSIQCMVATVQTLGKGQTLNEANQVFFFGSPYRAADFNQAIDRVHRIGQDTSVYIYNVLLYSRDKNITDRIDEIMEWSGELVDAIMNEETDFSLLESVFLEYGNEREKLLIKKLKEKI